MADKIRVAHVIPRYFPIFGGAETQCRQLVRHLVASGEVEIPFLVTARVEKEYAPLERIDDIPIYRIGSPGIGRWNWYLYYLMCSWFLIRRRKAFDVIHCHATSVFGLFMVITGRIIRKPVILLLASNGELLTGIGEMIRQYRLQKLRLIARKWMARFMARRSTIVTLNSEGGAEAEAALAGCSVIIPNGIDVEQYRPLDAEPRNKLRAEYGFGASDIVLLFVGRFVVGKGISTLLEAFEQLASDPGLRRIHLCLAGGAKLQVDTFDVTTLEDNPRLHILPPKIPAVEYYQMADMFVFPSQREGLPNVVLEALAVGLPCILSDIAPHKELQQTNPDADIQLFKTDDAANLAAVIREAVNREGSRVGQPCSVRLSDAYKIARVANEYICLYRRLCGANV